MRTKSNSDLFWDQIKDTYYAEHPALTLSSELMWCVAPKRPPVLDARHDQTADHIARLQQVFESLGEPALPQNCPAVDEFIEQGEQMLSSYTGTNSLEAGIAAMVQAVETYEISRFGTLCRWAELLGLAESLALLKKTFAERSAADQSVNGVTTKVAVDAV